MKKLIILALLAVATMTQAQQKIELWPEGAPHESVDEQDTAYIQLFLATPDRSKGEDGCPCVVICPGGGYTHLAMYHEGVDWAPVFNELGISVAVLKYRMPHGNKEIPFEDAEEALRLVRRNAAAWGIDPHRVGIMGSSAGGHLAATVATHALGRSKPNFQILFYPVITMDKSFTHMGSHDNLLGADASAELETEYSCEKKVEPTTPRAFIVLSDDDKVVPSLNGVSYYVALNANGVPAVLHVYPTGGHGWGLRSSFAHHAEMLMELKAWLKKL